MEGANEVVEALGAVVVGVRKDAEGKKMVGYCFLQYSRLLLFAGFVLYGGIGLVRGEDGRMRDNDRALSHNGLCQNGICNRNYHTGACS